MRFLVFRFKNVFVWNASAYNLIILPFVAESLGTAALNKETWLRLVGWVSSLITNILLREVKTSRHASYRL